MSLVKYGNAVQDMRGSNAGTTYTRSAAGATTRSKVSGTQRTTNSASQSKQAFGSVSQQWASLLNDSQRAAWIAYATTHPITNVFGDSIVLSGISCFTSLNKRLAELGFPIWPDPPSTPPPPAPGAIAPTLTIDNVPNCDLFINPTIPTGGGTVIALTYASHGVPPSRLVKSNLYKLINPPTAQTTDETTNFGTDYTTRYAPLIPSVPQIIGIKYLYLDTASGLISAPSSATIPVTNIPGPVQDVLAVSLATFFLVIIGRQNHGLKSGDNVHLDLGGGLAYLSGDYLGINVNAPDAWTAINLNPDVPMQFAGGSFYRIA